MSSDFIPPTKSGLIVEEVPYLHLYYLGLSNRYRWKRKFDVPDFSNMTIAKTLKKALGKKQNQQSFTKYLEISLRNLLLVSISLEFVKTLKMFVFMKQNFKSVHNYSVAAI